MTFKTFLVVLISLGGPRSPAPPTRLVKDRRSLTGCELFNALATSHQRDPFIQSFFLSANLPLIFFPISLIPEWESFPSSAWSNIDSSFFFTKVFSHVRARSPVIWPAAKEMKLISLPWKLHDYVIFKKVGSESDNVDVWATFSWNPFSFSRSSIWVPSWGVADLQNLLKLAKARKDLPGALEPSQAWKLDFWKEHNANLLCQYILHQVIKYG